MIFGCDAALNHFRSCYVILCFSKFHDGFLCPVLFIKLSVFFTFQSVAFCYIISIFVTCWVISFHVVAYRITRRYSISNFYFRMHQLFDLL